MLLTNHRHHEMAPSRLGESQNGTTSKRHPQKPAKSPPLNCYSGNRVIQDGSTRSRADSATAANSFRWITLAVTIL